jgi:V/A-type H+-transporting ATPase subunit E
MSEYSLDGLIAKVKSEAIERAEKEAQEIIDDAKAQAAKILEKANAEKEQRISEAEEQANAIRHKADIALNQAAREVSIATKNDLLALFKAVLQAEVQAAYDPDLYKTLVLHIVDTVGENSAITLPGHLEEQVVKEIHKKVANSEKSVKILQSNQLLNGLKVTKTDEGWSYNITAEEVTELLNQQLSKKWMDIFNQA